MTNAIFVTGAAGFIGFHLCRRLLDEGYAVVGVDILNDYYDVRLKTARLDALAGDSAFRFERLDVADARAFASLVETVRPRVLIHLAAQAGVRYSIENPAAYTRANIDGFLSVLEACRRTRPDHLIYASSSSVYGTNRKIPFHEDDPVLEPVSLYAATKRSNELMARTYAHLYGIPASGLRFFTVYGPYGRPDMAYYLFTKAIIEGQPIPLFNHGRMRRDFTYVDDIVGGIIGLVDKPPRSEGPALPDAGGALHAIYNIGNNRPVELSRFVAAIETAVGKNAVIDPRPMQPGDVPETYADIDRLSALTGFRPTVGIEEGIDRFVSWYRTWSATGGGAT